MKQKINRALLILCFVTIGFATRAQPSLRKFQTEVALPVKDFGKVYNVPFATDKPDPNMQYKIVFEASVEPFDTTSSHIYPPLEHMARMYNLHVYGGVSQKNLDVVLVIGGLGIPAVMSNGSFRKRYGIDNPNIKILEQLKAAGVKINGCAQSMLKNSIEPAELNANITPIFSRFTTVATYQLKGYAYFKY